MGFYLNNQYVTDTYMRYNLLHNNKNPSLNAISSNNNVLNVSRTISPEDKKILDKLDLEVTEANTEDLINRFYEILKKANLDMLSALTTLTRPHLLSIIYLLYENRINENGIKEILKSSNHHSRTEILLSYLSQNEEDDYINLFKPLEIIIRKMIGFHNKGEITKNEREKEISNIRSSYIYETTVKFLHGNYYYADKGSNSLFYYCPEWFDTVDSECLPDPNSKYGKILSGNEFDPDDFYDKELWEFIIERTKFFNPLYKIAKFSSSLRRFSFLPIRKNKNRISYSYGIFGNRIYKEYMEYKTDMLFLYSVISRDNLETAYAEYVKNGGRRSKYRMRNKLEINNINDYQKEFLVGYKMLDFFEEIMNHKHDNKISIPIIVPYRWYYPYPVYLGNIEIPTDFDPVYPSGYSAYIKEERDSDGNGISATGKHVNIQADKIGANLVAIQAMYNALRQYKNRFNSTAGSFRRFPKFKSYTQILFAKEFEEFFKPYLYDSLDEKGEINYEKAEVEGKECALIDFIDYFNLYEWLGIEKAIKHAKGLRKNSIDRTNAYFDFKDLDVKQEIQFKVPYEHPDRGRDNLNVSDPVGKPAYYRGLFNLVNKCWEYNQSSDWEDITSEEEDTNLLRDILGYFYGKNSELNKDFLKYFINTKTNGLDLETANNIVDEITTKVDARSQSVISSGNIFGALYAIIDAGINSRNITNFSDSFKYTRISSYDSIYNSLLDIDLLMDDGNAPYNSSGIKMDNGTYQFSIHNFGTIEFYKDYIEPMTKYFKNYNEGLLSKLQTNNLLDDKTNIENELVSCFNSITDDVLFFIKNGSAPPENKDENFYMNNFKDFYLMSIAKEIMANYIIYLFPDVDIRLENRITLTAEKPEKIIEIFNFTTIENQGDISIPAIYRKIFLIRHFMLGLRESMKEVNNSTLFSKLLTDPCNCNQLFKDAAAFGDQLQENKLFKENINDLTDGRKNISSEYINQYLTSIVRTNGKHTLDFNQ